MPGTSANVGSMTDEQGLLLITWETKQKSCMMVVVLFISVDKEK